MLDSLTIDDPAAAAVFAHARQRRILLALVAQERSLSQLSRATGTPLNLLHHHIGKLLRLGLARVTREARRAGSPIRFYRAVARAFFVPAEAMASPPGADMQRHLRELLDRSLLSTLKGVRYSHDGSGPQVRLVEEADALRAGAEVWLDLRLSSQEASAFTTELQQLLQRVAARSTSGGRRYLVHAAVAAV